MAHSPIYAWHGRINKIYRAQWIWERTNDKIGCGYADILQNGSIRNVSRNQVPKRGAKLTRQSKMAPGQ